MSLGKPTVFCTNMPGQRFSQDFKSNASGSHCLKYTFSCTYSKVQKCKKFFKLLEPSSKSFEFATKYISSITAELLVLDAKNLKLKFRVRVRTVRFRNRNANWSGSGMDTFRKYLKSITVFENAKSL